MLSLLVVPLSLSADMIAACSTPDALIQAVAAIEVADKATTEKESIPAKSAKCCAEKKDVPEAARMVSVEGRIDIPDVELVNQDGKSVRFFTDLVKGRTVAINTFYTSCTTICPTLSATVAQIQKTLKEKGRGDIQLISISVDPTTDTPKRLKAWSETFNLQPGWTMLTGRKSTVDKLLKALQSFSADAKDHSPMILSATNPWALGSRCTGSRRQRSSARPSSTSLTRKKRVS